MGRGGRKRCEVGETKEYREKERRMRRGVEGRARLKLLPGRKIGRRRS